MNLQMDGKHGCHTEVGSATLKIGRLNGMMHSYSRALAQHYLVQSRAWKHSIGGAHMQKL